MSTQVVSDTAPLDPGISPPRESGHSSDHEPTTHAADLAPNQHGNNVKDQIECAKSTAPVFLNSPPESNNTIKSDASDSELSELEEEPILDDAPSATTPDPPTVTAPAPAPTDNAQEKEPQQEKEEEEEDIGEVLPDDWSGAVPIFRPTWHQFKDFQKFVRYFARDCASPLH